VRLDGAERRAERGPESIYTSGVQEVSRRPRLAADVMEGKPRRAFLGLRSNVHFFKSPAGALNLASRLKALALLYDQLIFEVGVYDTLIAEHMVHERVSPWRGDLDALKPTRSKRGRPLVLTYKSLEQPGIGGTVETAEQQRYRAQFISTILELISIDADWAGLVCFLPQAQHFPTGQRAKQVAQEWIRQDEAELLQVEKRLPEYWRRALIKHLYTDVAHSLLLGADVAPDERHEKILRHLAAQGRHTAPTSGIHTLTLRLPNVQRATWQQVSEMRKDPGIESLRARLRECDAAGGSDADLIRRIDEEYARDMERYRPSWRDATISIAWNLISAMPLIGSIPAVIQTGMALAEADASRRHWTVSLMRIHRRLEP
jgi:hypothetical protein